MINVSVLFIGSLGKISQSLKLTWSIIRLFGTALQGPMSHARKKCNIHKCNVSGVVLMPSIIVYLENFNIQVTKEACFRCLFVEKEESSSHTENFYIHLFLTWKRHFFSISNFNRKIKAQVIEVVNWFFLSKYITPNKIPFSILKWQNKRFTLEDKKRFHLVIYTLIVTIKY